MVDNIVGVSVVIPCYCCVETDLAKSKPGSLSYCLSSSSLLLSRFMVNSLDTFHRGFSFWNIPQSVTPKKHYSILLQPRGRGRLRE